MVPDVSVVVPVYNVEQWLPACLDSVLAQTLQSIEVICVDDCSPDGCAGILADYAKRDARVRVLSLEQNGGQGIARNRGFAAATGRYTYFLDSDDMIAPEALENLVARADDEQLDGLFFDSQVVFDTPDLAQRYKSYPAVHTGSYPSGAVSGLALFEAFMAQRDWTCYVQRQLWRSAYLRDNDILFPTYPSHEDEGFAFEAIARAPRVAFMAEPYFIRRYRAGSVMTSRPTLRNFASYFQGYCHIAHVMHDCGIRSVAAERNLARIYDALVRIYTRLQAENVDVEARFADTGLLGAYLVFSHAQNSYLHHGMLSASVLSQVKEARRVYVYGAGVLAGNVFETLVQNDVALEGFLVSDPSNNSQAFKGHHVWGIDSVPCDSEAIVVIGVTDGYRADVESLLDRGGWRHVYCKDGWLA